MGRTVRHATWPAIPVRKVTWRPCTRIIPSRFPPVQLFERVADPEDLEAVMAIESLTNDRLRNEVGQLELVPPAERVSGPGSSYIMAAFTHPAPGGTRFTDGSFGAFYAARDEATAIAETRYHRERFLRATREGPMQLDMRVLAVNLDADMHDVRGMRPALPEIYDPDNYAASQALARQLRRNGSWGIAAESVRRPGGECVAVFRPRALSRCRDARYLCYVWNGRSIDTVYEKRPPSGTRHR